MPRSVTKAQSDGSLANGIQVVAREPQGWKDLKKSRTQNCLFQFNPNSGPFII